MFSNAIQLSYAYAYVCHPPLLILVSDVLYPGYTLLLGLYTYTVYEYMTFLHGSLPGKKGPFAPFHPDKVLCFL